MSALPRWKCHKIVEAVKIVAGAPLVNGGYELTPESAGIDAIRVPESFFARGMPDGPYYFVRYDGGTEKEWVSWSPAHVFEAGYTRLDEPMVPHMPSMHEAAGCQHRGNPLVIVEDWLPGRPIAECPDCGATFALDRVRRRTSW